MVRLSHPANLIQLYEVYDQNTFSDNTTHFEAYLSGVSKKEVSVTLAVEAIIFLIFACFLEVLARLFVNRKINCILLQFGHFQMHVFLSQKSPFRFSTYLKLSKLSSHHQEQEEQPGCSLFLPNGPLIESLFGPKFY